jgi:hypothetical protein
VAFRRLSLSNLGRSGVLLIGRLDAGTSFVLTVTAATKRPVQLRFDALPDTDALAAALDDGDPRRPLPQRYPRPACVAPGYDVPPGRRNPGRARCP